MNIIFGNAVNLVSHNYTKLELDTIQLSSTGESITAYGVIESIPMAEFPRVESNARNHAMLMKQYRMQNWGYCEQAINALMGAWNGELDSFYSNLMTRIEKFKESPPPADWDGRIIK